MIAYECYFTVLHELPELYGTILLPQHPVIGQIINLDFFGTETPHEVISVDKNSLSVKVEEIKS